MKRSTRPLIALTLGLAAACLAPFAARAAELVDDAGRRVELPERDDPRDDAELVALRPDVYVDYGTVDDDYTAALEAITARTGVPGLIFDGRLENIPSVYRRLGAALGVAERGERLAVVAEGILRKYSRALGAVAPAGQRPPAVPFNWGPRPPSVNRLLGLVWLVYVVPGRDFDAEFYADVTALLEALYHVSPTPEQLRELVAR